MTEHTCSDASLRMRRGTPADLPFVLATERLPGYDRLVGRWSADEHDAALRRADVAYLVYERGAGDAVGFAICDGLDDEHHGIKLRRIALTETGAGLGRRFLADILHWAFTGTGAQRLWLDVFVWNQRARRAYRGVGMAEDGILRRAYVMPDGERVDRILMSILREEWERRCASP